MNQLSVLCDFGPAKTGGCVSRAGMLAMVLKLTTTAEQKLTLAYGSYAVGPSGPSVKFKDGLQEDAHKFPA